MRLLIDTHIFIWWIKNNKNLSKFSRDIIINADEVFISSASIWEAAIKIKLKKLDVNIHDLVNAIIENGFTELPINVKHAAIISELKDIHRDPFDRILIAQAISEPLQFLTADKMLQQYSGLVVIN